MNLAKLEDIQQEFDRDVSAVEESRELQDIKVKYLGKKGLVSVLMRDMKELPNEDKPKWGQAVNQLRTNITSQLAHKESVIKKRDLDIRLASETIDVTLPGRTFNLGASHPIQRIVLDIEDFFIGLGYSVKDGHEVETDYYNFELLNLPKTHPARDMQDSFYISNELLLRTHTSPVQARVMMEHAGEGPIKIICPGKVYRRDSDDATHSHQFTQIEGLVVDKRIRMSDLKGTLELFAKEIFGNDRNIRLRPSYFPFTEPSVEVDISCFNCMGNGCNVCKKSGWIEILGAGMVHPNVLEMCGFDSQVYSGFAFGMGPERIAMLKYGIEDIRHFYTNDIRFTRQFIQTEDRGDSHARI